MIKKILTNYKLSFTEKVEFKKWLLMYFYENYNKQDNIIDINKNVKTNIRNIKKRIRYMRFCNVYVEKEL